MDFTELQKEMNNIIEDVKKAIELPIDAEGKMAGGAQLTLEDLEKLLERTQGVVDKLNRQATEMAAEKGLSRDEMAHYVENPKNFSGEEWKAMQSMKTQVDQFQKMLMRSVIAGQGSAPKEEKGRPGKQKRDWIPM